MRQLAAALRCDTSYITTIVDNLEVTTRVLPLEEARALGAMALFGAKYGNEVRVVQIGSPWSLELCAGTHVSRSSEVGLINLISESSIGSTKVPVPSQWSRSAPI